LDISSIGQVAAQGHDLSPVFLEILSRPHQLLLVSRADRQPTALAGKLPGKQKAKSTRTAGDQRYFAMQIGLSEPLEHFPADQS
jgi:hypothetical protein